MISHEYQKKACKKLPKESNGHNLLSRVKEERERWLRRSKIAINSLEILSLDEHHQSNYPPKMIRFKKLIILRWVRGIEPNLHTRRT